MTRISAAAAMSAVLSLSLAGCEAKKSSNPLSPSVAGPIAGVNITAPKLLEPAQGFKYKESQQPIKLVIENSTTSGVRPILYMFEVAADSNFETKVYARSAVPAGEGGRTNVIVDRLDLGRAYYWRARADDGANTSQFSSAQFEVLPKPQLNAPGLLSPINNEQIATRRPTFRVSNSDHNAAVGSLNYEFQVSTSQSFGTLVAGGMSDEGGGETTFTSQVDLTASVQHFWRVRSTDGETTSTWAATQTFRTPAAPPSPAPGPAPAPGGPCNSSSPLSIVECERAKYGHMSPSQTVEFERAVARSLNRNGISGGPFGILRKAGGFNCNGYSCDILCAGSGNGQRQWDILGDADGSQDPGWSGPHTVPNIRVDVCEIQ